MNTLLLLTVWALFCNEVLNLRKYLGDLRKRKTQKAVADFFAAIGEKNKRLREQNAGYREAQKLREAPELAAGAHPHDAPVDLQKVTLLRAEGPYLTVREEGLLDGAKVTRVMTIYDGQGRMARVFIEEAKRTGRKLPEGVALELLDPGGAVPDPGAA